MATFLELGLLKYFSIIFPVLLVFVIVFMLLEKTKILGDNKTLHAIIAIALAFIVMLSEDLITIINFIAPWFVLVFVFLVLLLLIYRFFGASDEDLAAFIKKDRPVQWAIFAVGIIIIVSAISHVYGERLLPYTEEGKTNITGTAEISTATASFRENVMNVFFHPKVIGTIFILLVAVFAIALLTRSDIPSS